MRMKGIKNRWVELLPQVVQSHNTEYAFNTKYKRLQIRPENYADFLAAKRKVDSIYDHYNTASLKQSILQPKSWRKKIWKYQVNDRVLISITAGYTSDIKTQRRMKKASVLGSWLPETYVIVEGFLRASWSSPKYLVPVYYVTKESNLPDRTPIGGIFYQRELKFDRRTNGGGGGEKKEES